MADMKQVLLKLGHKLVEEHGFKPASMMEKTPKRSTDPLVSFLLWLDKTPEALEELENLGFSFVRTGR